jgi:hypothetical protein
MPSKRSPFGSPVEPISPPPKPALLKRAWVEAPGTAPGSERLISMSIYRRSRSCERRVEYRAKAAAWEEAIDLNGLKEARRKTVTPLGHGLYWRTKGGAYGDQG